MNKKLKFEEGISRFAGELSNEDDFLLVSHHDADGIASCAIISDLFKYLNKNFEFRILRQLDSKVIDSISETKRKNIVFTDLGSGQIGLIKEKFKDKKIFIIDHHAPEVSDERILNIAQVNPHIYGFDGSIEISGAGMAYFVARALGRRDKIDIAVVGAVGDMQDNSGGFVGLNKDIIEEGVQMGFLKAKKDLKLFGRESRSIVQMLAYASDPVLPTLSGNEAACVDFLNNQKIVFRDENGFRNYVDLSFDERKNLVSALYILLSDFNPSELKSLIGEVYTLTKEKKRTVLRDAKEFSTLLNACGRHNEPEIGVYVCLGDRNEALKKADSLLEKHRRMLRSGIEFLKTNPPEEMKNFCYFDAGSAIDENIVGIIAGMSYSAGIVNSKKPVLGFADDNEDDEMKKVSARATWEIVRRGVDLGYIMREYSKVIGGEGGGHSIAAGARIPKNRISEFLIMVDEHLNKIPLFQ